MFFFPFPFETVRSYREQGFSDEETRRFIKARPERPTDEDFQGWSKHDVAEYLMFLDGEDLPAATPDSAPASVVIHNHYHAPSPDPSPAPTTPPATATTTPPAPVTAASPDPAPAASPASKTPLIPYAEDLNERQLKGNHINDGSARDFLRALNLFAELTGIEFVEDITQVSLTKFVDLMREIPKDSRRSEKQREIPMLEIIRDAIENDTPRGLSVTTINKNLVHVGKLIRHAKADESVNISQRINPSIVRPKDTESKKDKRVMFSGDDIIKIFKHRLLNMSAERNELFWIAHCAALSGARKEEISGLAHDEVRQDPDSGIWFFDIKPNDFRGLKNGQSKRRVPVHDDLIKIGFIDYVKSRQSKPGLLFDVRKKSKNAAYGDFFDYRWRKAMTESIGSGHGKTFHSFRHSATQHLLDQEVIEATRAAIFGHDSGIEGGTYGGDWNLETLQRAVNLLPSVRNK
ncbi:hypothetical protein IQ24_00356 [Paracoccus sulfuroxidans]|uniref:Phage integrase family protein n=2 Tax=Paracoccus sulfuroxidans TaxID=384678 RepID=A0A562P155_9RHOB|nr:hypothetical protein IQ24_00356 [Paracoccus sulfuroxidans]